MPVLAWASGEAHFSCNYALVYTFQWSEPVTHDAQSAATSGTAKVSLIPSGFPLGLARMVGC